MRRRGPAGPRGRGSVSPNLYGFVRGREPASPDEIVAEFLQHPNGAARARVERLVEGDPRFLWDGEGLRTVDLALLALEDAPYVVFDLETTGASAGRGGVTELGALKLSRGQVFEEFVDGAVLVGHNVTFDCSFVTAARGGSPLPNPVLDTLRLARCLIPGLRRYRLSSLVSHFGVRTMPRHRALSDATATAGVFLRLLKLLRSAGVRSVGEAAALRGGGRVRPQKQHLAEGVPDTPGVYYFLDKHGTTLYVGKAKNLRARVRTYFNGGGGRGENGRPVGGGAGGGGKEKGGGGGAP